MPTKTTITKAEAYQAYAFYGNLRDAAEDLGISHSCLRLILDPESHLYDRVVRCPGRPRKPDYKLTDIQNTVKCVFRFHGL
jgi:hypothetical protein